MADFSINPGRLGALQRAKGPLFHDWRGVETYSVNRRGWNHSTKTAVLPSESSAVMYVDNFDWLSTPNARVSVENVTTPEWLAGAVFSYEGANLFAIDTFDSGTQDLFSGEGLANRYFYGRSPYESGPYDYCRAMMKVVTPGDLSVTQWSIEWVWYANTGNKLSFPTSFSVFSRIE